MSSDDEEEFFRQQQQKLEKGASNVSVKNSEEDYASKDQSFDMKKRSLFGRSSVPGQGFGNMLKGRGSFTSKGGSGVSARGEPSKQPGNDSDDDNMSMSSEDEMDSGRKAALERQETRMIRGDAAARAPPSMRPVIQKAVEGEDGDEGEAELWEQVDEGELARRVRELRDPRAAVTTASVPAAPMLKRNASGIENVSTVQTDLTDPLGLGPLDLETLSLTRTNAPAALSEEVAVKVDKLLYFEETFNPRVYLAQIHRDSLLQELENGKLKLKRDVASHKEELKKLVKDNFDIFISCKDTIDDIHKRLIEMESDKGGAGTRKLKLSIRDCDEVARRAFGPLLERQAQVERIRSVQGLLQKFRTLFNLPSHLRAFVKAGEYDKAVTEYTKAKSLRLPVNSGIVKRVFEEADKGVMELKEALYAHMADPKEELAQIEYKMKLLLELEPDSDPVWHYLQLQELRIRGLLEGALQEAAGHLEGLQQKQKDRQLSEQRWKQLQFESSMAAGSEVDLGMLLGDEHLLDEEAADVAMEEASDALHSRLIRRLTAVVRQQVPRFWKLALNIFAGRFANFSDNARHGETPLRTPLRQEEAIPGCYSKHSLEEVGAMVVTILASYEDKILHAFSQLEQASGLRPYMREALGEVVSSMAALKLRDASPPSAVSALESLRVEVADRFVKRLCNVTRGAVIELAEEEDWVPAPSVQRGGAPYCISFFPLKFKNTLTAALDHVAPVLEQLSEEEEVPSVGAALRVMRESLRNMFYESFLDFCEILERMSASLSVPGAQDLEGSGQEGGGGEDGLLPSPVGGPGEGSVSAEYSGVQVGVEVTSVDQKILMLLSNAGFCRTSVLPLLVHKYQELWTQGGYEDIHGMGYGQLQGLEEPPMDSSSMLTELEQHLADLERVVGDKYIEIKANHLGHAVIKYFLEDGTSWATAPPVKGLRDSALELMHPLVAVHAEAYSGCRPFVEKAINMLAEGLMDALNQVAMQHQDLQQLDVNAYCQLSLELDYFGTVLEPFASPSLVDIVDQLREMLRQRTMESIQTFQTDSEADRGHRRLTRLGGPDRGYDDGGGGDNVPQSSEDLKHLADSISADLLPGELRRTKINVYCFNGRQEPDNSVGVALNLSHNLDPLSIPNSQYHQPYGAPSNMQRTYSNSSSASSMQGRLQAPATLAGASRMPSAPGGMGAAGRNQMPPQSLARRGRAMTADPQGMPPTSVYRTQSQQYDDYGGSGRPRQGDPWMAGGQGGGGYGRERGASGRGMRSGYRVEEDM